MLAWVIIVVLRTEVIESSLVFKNVVAENTGGNQRERNRLASVFLRQREGGAVAGNQPLALSTLTAQPAASHWQR